MTVAVIGLRFTVIHFFVFKTIIAKITLLHAYSTFSCSKMNFWQGISLSLSLVSYPDS